MADTSGVSGKAGGQRGELQLVEKRSKKGIGAVGLLVIAGSLGACSDGSERPVAVVDSAGIEIVTNLPGSIESAETWTLSSEPAIEIGGGLDPEVPLFRVTAVVPLPGNRVAVGTDSPSQVLVFGEDGTVAATLGRQGEGPGEYSSVGSVVLLPGDSLAVWDPDRRRVYVYSAAGGYGREVDLVHVVHQSTRAAGDIRQTTGFTHLLSLDSSSLIVFGEGVTGPNPEPGFFRPEMPAPRITLDGEEITRLGPFPGMVTHVGGPAGPVPAPFGARTYATASGGRLLVGTAETTEFRIYGPDGVLVRIVRWPDQSRAVTGPFLSRWEEMVDAKPDLKGLVEMVPPAETFPAYEGMIPVDGGEILVGEYPGPLGIFPLRRADHGPDFFRPDLRIPGRWWLVFGSRGAVSATLRTPEGFEPYAGSDGLVWGVYSDELDVESVRAYQLLRD